MAQKPGISFERHQEIGPMLKDICEQLTHLSTEFGNAYPLAGRVGRPYRELRKAVNAIHNARSDAEENYFTDYPERADFDTYYPGQDPGPYKPGRKQK